MNEPSTYFIRREIPEPEFAEFSNSGVVDEPSARDFLRVIARHKGLIVMLVLLGLLSAGALIFVMPPAYMATCTILVDHRAPKVDLKPAASETQELSDEEADNYYGTQYKILQSRSLALRVIQDLGLESSPLLNPRPLLALVGIKVGSKQSKKQIQEKAIEVYSGKMGEVMRKSGEYQMERGYRSRDASGQVTSAVRA